MSGGHDDHGGHGDAKAKKGCWAKFVEIFWKIWKATIDNRRFRAYAIAIIKFVTITLVQANETFPKDEDYFYNYRNIFLTLGYAWMVILILMFTERYVRELIFVK